MTDLLDAFARVSVFQDLPPETLAHLARLGQARAFGPGELLLRQGEPSESMHVIVRGQVRVDYASPAEPAPLRLRELGPGEVVGEMGLLDGAPRSASVTAIEETATLELRFSALAVAATEHPEVAASLLRTLSGRLRSATELAAAARDEAIRLEGVLLAARTMEHHINNQLALTVGYCELVARDPRRLPADVRQIAEHARAGAQAAADTVQKFRRITRVRELDSRDLPPLLDIEDATT